MLDYPHSQGNWGLAAIEGKGSEFVEAADSGKIGPGLSISLNQHLQENWEGEYYDTAE